METYVELQELGYTRLWCDEEMSTTPTSKEPSHITPSREGVSWRKNEASGSFPFWSSGYAIDRVLSQQTSRPYPIRAPQSFHQYSLLDREEMEMEMEMLYFEWI